MKQNYTSILLILLIIGFSSCQNIDYQMSTYIHRDGSCTREIRKESRDSAFITGDTSSHPFPFYIGSGWEISCYDSLQNKTYPWPLKDWNNQNYILIAKRHFPDVQAMSEACKPIYGPWQAVKPDISLRKSFRWFYTHYTYTEIYPQYCIPHPIPLDQYMTPQEQNIWYQGNDSVYRGNNGVELYNYLQSMEEKATTWFNHNNFAVTYTLLQEHLPDNPFASRFTQARDSVFRKYQHEYDAMNSIYPYLNKYFETDYFTKLPGSTTTLIDSLLELKTDALNLYSINFRYELQLPGRITSASTQLMEGHKLIWKLNAYYFLPAPYTITATSRTVNYWAFIITGVLLVCISLYPYKKRKR